MNLIHKKLLESPHYISGKGTTFGNHFGLTDLAYDMLSFADKYEDEIK